MFRIESATYAGVYYWINPLHVVKVWKEKDGFTRLEQTSGAILFPKESPEEIVNLMRRTEK